MGDAKAVLSLPGGTVQVEGSEDFVRRCTAKLTEQHAHTKAGAPLLDKGIDHAWQWFSLHATHRMQAVDFFLVTSAFLSAAYVSALHFTLPVVAAGVGLLGVLASVFFFLFEMRIRELVKAAEDALRPAQRALAQETGVEAFEICEIVEVAKFRYSSYHRVITLLYCVTAIAFLGGILYALCPHAAPGFDSTSMVASWSTFALPL